MRTEFNKLVELMNRYDLYQKDDEVGIALNDLEQKIIEVEKRMECVKRTNIDINEIVFTNQVKLEKFIGYDNVEILQRSCNDIDIAIDMNDTEPINNDWYGLFGTRNGNIHTEKPPTELCKDEIKHLLLKEVIESLKVINVDGETMQYILEQVGLDEHFLPN